MRGGRLSSHHLFYDRPDVLSVYTVRVDADRKAAPILLSNGNPVENGMVEGQPERHFAVWHDPHPNPPIFSRSSPVRSAW